MQKWSYVQAFITPYEFQSANLKSKISRICQRESFTNEVSMKLLSKHLQRQIRCESEKGLPSPPQMFNDLHGSSSMLTDLHRCSPIWKTCNFENSKDQKPTRSSSIFFSNLGISSSNKWDRGQWPQNRVKRTYLKRNICCSSCFHTWSWLTCYYIIQYCMSESVSPDVSLNCQGLQSTVQTCADSFTMHHCATIHCLQLKSAVYNQKQLMSAKKCCLSTTNNLTPAGSFLLSSFTNFC